MTVFRNNRRDMRRIQSVPKGATLYVIEEVALRVAPYEDSRLCSRHTVTGTHRLLGGAMVGSKSVEQLLAEHGTVYTSQPKGVRGIWEPSPQVAGPLGAGTERYLDETEIRGLEKQVRDANEDRRKAKRRGRWI